MHERGGSHQNAHFPVRAMQNVHLDVLDGRDGTLEPVDYLPSGVDGEMTDIHAAMERKVGL